MNGVYLLVLIILLLFPTQMNRFVSSAMPHVGEICICYMGLERQIGRRTGSLLEPYPKSNRKSAILNVLWHRSRLHTLTICS